MNDNLRVSVDHLLEGVQIVDRDWTYVYVNKTAAEHGRSSPDALIGRTMMAAYPGIDQTPLFQILRRVMETGKPEVLLNKFQYPSGEERWFDLRIEPVPDGVCVLSVDVTERQRLNDEVQRQRLHVFQATMRTVHDIVNNFLNNLQLIRLEAEGRLSDDILKLFDEMTNETSVKMKALGELQILNERQMGMGVGIDYPGA